MLRRATVLIISSLLGGVCLAAPPAESSTQCRHYWCSFPPAGLGYVSVAYAQQDGAKGDDDLNGMSLAWGGWTEDPYRRGLSRPFPNALGVHFWLSEVENDVQRLWSGGLGADLSFLALGPARLFPRGQVGLKFRTDDPDEGWGLVTRVGLGTGIFLGHRCQIVLALDRDFDPFAADSNRVSLEIRWLHPKIQFPIAE